jgi:hypothetical protein
MKTFAFVVSILAAVAMPGFGRVLDRPAVIITQDGEVDDRSSFVRFLLYTPDMDLRGVVATNSKWQREGHGLDWIFEAYERYGQVRENLLLHHPGYPSVQQLKSLTVSGNEDPLHLTGGAPYADTEGSELILRELRKIEGSPLHIACWGGMNTVVQALWRFRTDFAAEFARKAPLVRIVAIDFQDEAGDWLVKHMPEIRVIRCNAFHMTWNYHSPQKPLEHNPHPLLMSERWLEDNVKKEHGPLGASYPQDNISEGDTPAFLSFIDNGLRAHEDFSWGGWGGRYRPVQANYWMDAPDDGNEHKSLWRWIPAIQNDFAARMDWCVKPYEAANHPPMIDTVTPSRIVKPGEHVELQARAHDPDGDRVFYFWWHYRGPGGESAPIRISHETASQASFVVPANASGAIHLILEVTDDGDPTLTRYERLIFAVAP